MAAPQSVSVAIHRSFEEADRLSVHVSGSVLVNLAFTTPKLSRADVPAKSNFSATSPAGRDQGRTSYRNPSFTGIANSEALSAVSF